MAFFPGQLQGTGGPGNTWTIGSNGTIAAPPGMYWKDPNTLAEIPDPAIGTAAGETQNAYTTAATPGLSGLINGTSGASSTGLGGSSSLSSLTSAAGIGGAGTAGVGGTVSAGGTSSDPTVASIAPVDMTQANSAALGAAQDTAGQQARSSIDTMNSLLGSQGQLGGGAQVQGTRDIVENALSAVGGVNRQNLTNTASGALTTNLANQNAAVTQRGQDIQSQEAAAQLALSQQEFLSNQSLNALKLALSGSSATPSVAASLY